METSSSVVFLFLLRIFGARGERSFIALGLGFDLAGDFSAMLDPVMQMNSGGAGFFEAGLGESIQEREFFDEGPCFECGDFSWKRHGNVSLVVANANADNASLESLQEIAEDALARSTKWFTIGWGEPVWLSFEGALLDDLGPLCRTASALSSKPALSLAQEAGKPSAPPETEWIEALVERARLEKATPAAESLPRRSPPRV